MVIYSSVLVCFRFILHVWISYLFISDMNILPIYLACMNILTIYFACKKILPCMCTMCMPVESPANRAWMVMNVGAENRTRVMDGCE